LHELLIAKFGEVDFKQAASDVRPFIREPEMLTIWSSDFFKSITKDKLKISE